MLDSVILQDPTAEQKDAISQFIVETQSCYVQQHSMEIYFVEIFTDKLPELLEFLPEIGFEQSVTDNKLFVQNDFYDRLNDACWREIRENPPPSFT